MEQQPPPSYNPPPGESPTEPTRRVVEPAAPAEPVEQELTLDPELAEKIDRASFWSRFGSAAAVAAAILGIIALFVALDARDTANSDGGNNAALEDDVNELQSDVNKLERQVASSDQSDIDSQLTEIQDQLKQISDDQQKQAQDIQSVQQDLSELSDRVDQVEQAQEDAAAGGP